MGDVTWLKGDSFGIKLVIIKLISNAIKFTQAGFVELNIETRPIFDYQVELIIQVNDSGRGMTEEEGSRLFKDYSQANANVHLEYGGSGLGLKICREIITHMKGEIKVKNSKKNDGSSGEHGTSFEFKIICALPANDEQLKNEESLETVSTISKKNMGFRILIVEDNPVNAKMTHILLENAGYQCTIASDGSEAYSIWQKSIKQGNKFFDAILMDVNLKKMSGLDCTKKIRGHKKGNNLTPIIGYTGDTDEEIKSVLIKAGMNMVLTKPCDKQILLKTIEDVCQNPSSLVLMDVSESNEDLEHDLTSNTASSNYSM